MKNMDIDDKTGYKIPPMHVYLRINNTPFSTPSQAQAENLFRPRGNSLEHCLSGEVCKYDYSFITISHFATGFGVYDSAVGELRILAKDMQDLEFENIKDPEKALEVIRGYNSKATTSPGVCRISFKSSVVDVIRSWMVYESLKSTKSAKEIALTQLLNMSHELNKPLDKGPHEFEILWLPLSTAAADDDQKFVRLFESLHRVESKEDPYGRFFPDNQTARTLPLGKLVDMSSPDFVPRDIQPRHTRYASADQQFVYQALGTANEFVVERIRLNKLQGSSFPAYFIPCPHVEAGRRAIMIIQPEGKTGLLPQNGEVCKVQVSLKKCQDSPQVSNDEFQTIFTNISEDFSKFAHEEKAVDLLSESLAMFFLTPPSPFSVVEIGRPTKSRRPKAWKFPVSNKKMGRTLTTTWLASPQLGGMKWESRRLHPTRDS